LLPAKHYGSINAAEDASSFATINKYYKNKKQKTKNKKQKTKNKKQKTKNEQRGQKIQISKFISTACTNKSYCTKQ